MAQFVLNFPEGPIADQIAAIAREALAAKVSTDEERTAIEAMSGPDATARLVVNYLGGLVVNKTLSQTALDNQVRMQEAEDGARQFLSTLDTVSVTPTV